MAKIYLKSCALKVKCKKGSTSSGSDSTYTISLKGCNQEADAQLLLDTSDALSELISTPVLEILRSDEMLVSAE